MNDKILYTIFMLQSPVQMVGSLNQASHHTQQYLSQLTQQTASDGLKPAAPTHHHQYHQNAVQSYNNTSVNQQYNSSSATTHQPPTASQVYTTNQQQQQYGSGASNNPVAYVNNSYNNAYNDQSVSQQPVRTTKQRARVPPPSKVRFYNKRKVFNVFISLIF